VSAAPDIAASLLDALVWKEAITFIRNPSKLEENLAKQKTTDPTKDELTVIDGLLQEVIGRIRNITQTIETTPPSDGRDLLVLRLDELAAKKKEFKEKRDLLLGEKTSWADEQHAIDAFKEWCAANRSRLDNPEYEPTYEEKRNALERLGMVVSVFPVDYRPRILIETRH
jgi:hypothetical protein